MRHLLTAAIIAISGLTAFSAPAPKPVPSVLDIKHSLRDDNVRPPESFETQTRALEENFFLKNYTDTRPNSKNYKLGNAEEYTRKLAEINSAIELPYNPVVGKFIDMYIGKRRSLVSNMLALHDYYGGMFIEELEKEEMPLELQYLPVIESAINPNAVSRAGATGLWQIMPATAKGLGLEVSSLVDERRAALESTRSAVKYLKQLYNIYGDWSLAIAAYNCGPGNVNKARRRAGNANSDFWEIYSYLPSETRGYVPAFIAANYVMTYHDDYGIHRPLVKRPLITDTVEIRERVHFNQIANVLNIPVDEIRMLNPQYRRDVIPGSQSHPYILTLPSQQVLSYISSRDAIMAYEENKYNPRTTVEIGPRKKEDNVADNQGNVTDSLADNGENQLVAAVNTDEVVKKTHTVGRGEDLGSIAKAYGVSATDIKHWNNLRRGKVREGDQLIIEIRQRNAVTAVNTRANRPNTNADVTTTAKTNSVSAPTETGRYNSYSSSRTQRAVPQRNSEKYKKNDYSAHSSKYAKNTKNKKKSTKKTVSKPKEVTVKSGESLERIAKKHGTTVDALRKANGMKKNETMLHPGDKLKLPKSKASGKRTKSKKSKRRR